MDTQTRHALKKDKFAQAAASSVSWVSGHRSGVLRWVIGSGVVLVLVVGALIFWNMRSTAADLALGAAMDIYNDALAAARRSARRGVYTTAADRAKEANREFVAVAKDFSWLPEGTKAHYFAGVTYQELGQNGPAETELKAAAGSWDRNLANLAKLALAGLYHQTAATPGNRSLQRAGRQASVTVSAGVAQLDLADLYAAKASRTRRAHLGQGEGRRQGRRGRRRSPRKSSPASSDSARRTLAVRRLAASAFLADSRSQGRHAPEHFLRRLRLVSV